MINSIINGISIAINAAFGDGYTIYSEEIKQGLKEPCFSIMCLNPTSTQVLNRRYFRKNLFCIQYFPKDADKNEEINNVVECLFSCLEYITVDANLTRGTEMHNETIDGVINFFVNYDMFMYRTIDSTMMEDLSTNTDVKG